ncbi:glycosyltransferase [Salimicrobium sp. PL1-032A]|uniref:glycosyltransferase n=1 Tax=Salimicrobium sp. PL1-032A TaxID=3095364 RepID=UPI003261B241
MLGMVHDPREFIRSMDLLVLTSLREVFPMVILEAMASGTPVLSIDRGGIKEAVADGETGFLIPEHSADAFAEAVVAMHQSTPEDKENMSRAGRKKAEEEFSLEKMVRETMEEYLECGKEETEWKRDRKPV